MVWSINESRRATVSHGKIFGQGELEVEGGAHGQSSNHRLLDGMLHYLACKVTLLARFLDPNIIAVEPTSQHLYTGYSRCHHAVQSGFSICPVLRARVTSHCDIPSGERRLVWSGLR